MAARVTIQDIADSLGVSRNTVSKAINNTGILADATREKILKKAMEMGYKQFSYANIVSYSKPEQTGSTASIPAADGIYAAPSLESPSNTNKKNEIALITSAVLGSSHFSALMLDKFQQEIFQMGYNLTMYRVLPYEIAALKLPGSFNTARTAGIICIEMFNYAYCQMLCEMETPTLFVDTPITELSGPLKSDCLYMNNHTNIHAFVREMIRRDKANIGFIGDYRNCQSFFERYMATRNALFLSGQNCHEPWFLIDNPEKWHPDTRIFYKDYLIQQIRQMDSLPDVFICANDFVAMDVLEVLEGLGISVPNDIWLCGFDDAPESRRLTPKLTTIHIHTQIMGISAADLLMTRIQAPDLNYRTIYTETDLIYRESTGD